MINLRIAAIVFLGGVIPSDACACMTEPLPSAVLFDNRPSEIPKDSIAIRVKLISVVKNSYSFTAKIISAEAPLTANQIAEIAPQWYTSCLAIGRGEKAAHVVVTKPQQGTYRPKLIAQSYRRSWLDTFWSYLGIQSFTATGKALGNPFPS